MGGPMNRQTAPAGGQLVGLPFNLSNLSLPVSGTFVCNCAPVSERHEIHFTNSGPIHCVNCGKTYSVVYDPAHQKFLVTHPIQEQPQGQPS